MEWIGDAVALGGMLAVFGVAYLIDKALKHRAWQREYRAFRRDSGRAE